MAPDANKTSETPDATEAIDAPEVPEAPQVARHLWSLDATETSKAPWGPPEAPKACG